MSEHIQSSKHALRQEMRARLQSITVAQRNEYAGKARKLLAAQPRWQAAESILFFAPLPDELDVWPLVEPALMTDRSVALPHFAKLLDRYVACEIHELDEDLKTGRFGIREPADRCLQIPLNRLDFVLVPGVAFDLQGRRLGRGKGYYDRLLADLRGTICGVAFDEQIVSELPVEPTDISVNCILTPTRWIEL
jgi:5-formyltetrahydrofolate cyclo-ligase